MLAEQQQAGDLWAQQWLDGASRRKRCWIAGSNGRQQPGSARPCRDICVRPRRRCGSGLEAVRAKSNSVGAWNSAQTRMFASQVSAAGQVHRLSRPARHRRRLRRRVAHLGSGVNVDPGEASSAPPMRLRPSGAQIEQNRRLTGLAFGRRARQPQSAQVTASALSASNGKG